MDLKSFISFYNLENEEVVSLVGDGSILVMKIKMEMKIEYIANGYRPEFDEQYLHEFIFASPTVIALQNKIIIGNVKPEDDTLTFLANGTKVVILNKPIKVKNYVAHLNNI